MIMTGNKMNLLPVNLCHYSHVAWNLFGVLLFLIVGSNGSSDDCPLIAEILCMQVNNINGEAYNDKRRYLSFSYGPNDEILVKLTSRSIMQGESRKHKNYLLDKAIPVGQIRDNVRFLGKKDIRIQDTYRFRALSSQYDPELICITLGALTKPGTRKQLWMDGDLYFTRNTDFWGKIHRWKKVFEPGREGDFFYSDIKLKKIDMANWTGEDFKSDAVHFLNYAPLIKLLENNVFLTDARRKTFCNTITNTDNGNRYFDAKTSTEEEHQKYIILRDANVN
jgi:hypothetical protein